MSEKTGTTAKPPKDASDTELLQTERDGDVVLITMVYRPYNLLGPKLMGALTRALDEAVTSGGRAVVIRSGLRHFSAGADLDLFDAPAARASDDGEGAPRAARASNGTVDFLRAFELTPVPIVASVHGVCLGGGFELALACDYIVAAASAKIGSVEATLGLHPLMGGVQRQVQRAGMARAKEMSMLARRYDPATLERWGLVNLVVADEALDSATRTIAQEFAHGPTLAHAATKKLAYIAANQGVAAADEAMAELQKPIWRSEDLKIGLASFRKNGPGLARFEGR
jgi:enoyl-CoA hydratase/carnithine racemase